MSAHAELVEKARLATRRLKNMEIETTVCDTCGQLTPKTHRGICQYCGCDQQYIVEKEPERLWPE